MQEGAFVRCTQDVDAAIPGGCRVKLHVGPGLIKRGGDNSDKEVKMIFDLDVSMSGNVPVNMAAASMQTVHTQAGSIFRRRHHRHPPRRHGARAGVRTAAQSLPLVHKGRCHVRRT